MEIRLNMNRLAGPSECEFKNGFVLGKGIVVIDEESLYSPIISKLVIIADRCKLARRTHTLHNLFCDIQNAPQEI